MWLSFRFPLSLRLVEEMLLERGIVVSYETVRRWAMKFGRDYARRLKRKRASRRDIWRLDEVVVTIGGKQHWLWRAVDRDRYILDEIVQTRRDTRAAKRLLTRLLKKHRVHRVGRGYEPKETVGKGRIAAGTPSDLNAALIFHRRQRLASVVEKADGGGGFVKDETSCADRLGCELQRNVRATADPEDDRSFMSCNAHNRDGVTSLLSHVQVRFRVAGASTVAVSIVGNRSEFVAEKFRQRVVRCRVAAAPEIISRGSPAP